MKINKLIIIDNILKIKNNDKNINSLFENISNKFSRNLRMKYLILLIFVNFFIILDDLNQI